MPQKPKLNIQAPPRVVNDLSAATEYLWALYKAVALQPGILGDQAEIGGLISQVSIDLEIDQGTPDYEVFVTITGGTGAPAANSDQIAQIVKERQRFTVVFKAAPGLNSSITFDWLTRR